jgi:hypothetical protein
MLVLVQGFHNKLEIRRDAKKIPSARLLRAQSQAIRDRGCQLVQS